MTAGYDLTPLAEADLDDTWDYVADRFGFDVADGVLDSLHKAFQLLAENPEIGHARKDIAPLPYSFWPVGPSLIAYRTDARPLQIVRVVRGARDWQGLLPVDE
jgi:plasmid stabilization system protein ParE